jgi:hypothetical protein
MHVMRAVEQALGARGIEQKRPVTGLQSTDLAARLLKFCAYTAYEANVIFSALSVCRL